MPAFIEWAVSLSIVCIAFFGWGLLVFYARRSALETDKQSRFAITSGASLFGWLVLAFALASSGVFQAAPARIFPAVALGLVAPLLTGLFLLYRSSALKTVLAAVPLPWLVGI